MRSKVRWAGVMVMMDADKLEKRVERCKKRGSEQLRWKDCMRWDTRRSGEDERWGGGGR